MVTIYKTPDNDIIGLTNTVDSKNLLNYFHKEEENNVDIKYQFIFHISGRSNRLDLVLNYDFLNIPEEKRFILSATEYIEKKNLRDSL